MSHVRVLQTNCEDTARVVERIAEYGAPHTSALLREVSKVLAELARVVAEIAEMEA